jgi:gamma-glutamyl:cysteine ligase YbdK (ATP-grasp superfamily)
VDERDKFAFYVAGVETGITYHLHSLWWDVRDHSRDEVEGRVGNGSTSLTTGGDALTGVGVDVPVGNELTVEVGDVQSGE